VQFTKADRPIGGGARAREPSGGEERRTRLFTARRGVSKRGECSESTSPVVYYFIRGKVQPGRKLDDLHCSRAVKLFPQKQNLRNPVPFPHTILYLDAQCQFRHKMRSGERATRRCDIDMHKGHQSPSRKAFIYGRHQPHMYLSGGIKASAKTKTVPDNSMTLKHSFSIGVDQ
jgi:hypothetical protein